MSYVHQLLPNARVEPWRDLPKVAAESANAQVFSLYFTRTFLFFAGGLLTKKFRFPYHPYLHYKPSVWVVSHTYSVITCATPLSCPILGLLPHANFMVSFEPLPQCEPKLRCSIFLVHAQEYLG